VLAIEIMFFWGPNVKQRFWASLPGAVIGTATWIGTSYLLGIYFRQYAHFNKTYGTLAGAIALMAWMYYSWFMILIGAEVNSELLKLDQEGRLPLKAPPVRELFWLPTWKDSECDGQAKHRRDQRRGQEIVVEGVRHVQVHEVAYERHRDDEHPPGDAVLAPYLRYELGGEDHEHHRGEQGEERVGEHQLADLPGEQDGHEGRDQPQKYGGEKPSHRAKEQERCSAGQELADHAALPHYREHDART
jgi:hypothetical protein